MYLLSSRLRPVVGITFFIIAASFLVKKLVANPPCQTDEKAGVMDDSKTPTYCNKQQKSFIRRLRKIADRTKNQGQDYPWNCAYAAYRQNTR